MKDNRTYFVERTGLRNTEDRLETLVNSLGPEEMEPVTFSSDRLVCPPPDPSKPSVRIVRVGTCIPYEQIG
jgi:hypothetical protein